MRNEPPAADAAFRCAECGASYRTRLPLCTSCGVDQRIVPVATDPGYVARAGASPPRPMAVVLKGGLRRGVLRGEWEERLGRWPPAVLALFYGGPGSFKSTLLTLLAGELAATGREVLYAATEEGNSPSLRDRWERLEVSPEGVFLLSASSPLIVAQYAMQPRWGAVIIDSVSAAGLKPYQLSMVVQERGVPVLGALQVDKAGDPLGPRAFEHVADVVVAMDQGEATVTKNRYGPLSSFSVLHREEVA